MRYHLSQRDRGSMGKCDNLLEKARNSQTNVTFKELCSLAECFGFALARTRGSHHIYKAPGVHETVNLQPMPDGKAKAYQVRQVLKHIERSLEQDGKP